MTTGLYKRPTLSQRFWSRVNKNGPMPHAKASVHTQCWQWTAPPNHNGYGQLSVNYSPKIASHVAHFLETGAWPVHCMLHKCDNTLCVRFSHLFEGTRADNMVDKCAKGRARSWIHRRAIMRKWQKDLMRDLRRLAAQPCAATVFPRSEPGCENNGNLCASCDARNELDKLVRQSNSLILNRAKAKLLAGCDSRVHLNARERPALKCH